MASASQSTTLVDEGSSPAPSLRSRQGSCRRCTKRKQRCVRNQDNSRCERCQKASEDCSYESSDRSMARKAKYDSLLSKLHAAEFEIARLGALSKAGTQSAHESGKSRASLHHADADLPQDHSLWGYDIHHRGASTYYIGAGSAEFFIKQILKMPFVCTDDKNLEKPADSFVMGKLPTCPLTASDIARPPPFEVAQYLFAAQAKYIGTIFAFSDPEEFYKLLAAGRSPPDLSDRNSCLSYAKLLMILAFGQLYSINQWTDHDGPPGFKYFATAVRLLPAIHENPSIQFVETLCLVGYFMQNTNRRAAAFLYLGHAVRMAVSLGLHHEDMDPSLSAENKEHRRRVWWSVYSLDRIMSAKSGNPLMVCDEDISTEMPSRLPGEAAYCPAVVLHHYTELSQILGRIAVQIYRGSRKSGSNYMGSVQNIMTSLSKWLNEIPDELKFDPTKPDISRESISTLLHYYQCINMTARPLVYVIVQKRLKQPLEERQQDWRVGLGQMSIRVIELCINAARDTVDMMAVADQRNLVATYGYMDGEHTISAAIVLLMVCLSFPSNSANTSAMNNAFGLLHNLSSRGNQLIGSRYRALLRLRDMVPPESAQSVNGEAEMAARRHQGQGSMIQGPDQRSFPQVDNTDMPFMYNETHDLAPLDEFLWQQGFADPLMKLQAENWFHMANVHWHGSYIGDFGEVEMMGMEHVAGVLPAISE